MFPDIPLHLLMYDLCMFTCCLIEVDKITHWHYFLGSFVIVMHAFVHSVLEDLQIVHLMLLVYHYHDISVCLISDESVVNHHWCFRIQTPRSTGGLGPMNIPLLADKTLEISRRYGCLKEDECIAFRQVICLLVELAVWVVEVLLEYFFAPHFLWIVLEVKVSVLLCALWLWGW